MVKLFSLVEFIKIAGDPEELVNLVGNNLTQEEVDNLIANRPIVYSGHREVEEVYYRSFTDLSKYLKEAEVLLDWNGEVNVNGCFSAADFFRNSIAELESIIVDDSLVIGQYGLFCLKEEDSSNLEKLTDTYSSKQDSLAVLRSGNKYLKSLIENKKEFEH